MKSGRLRKSTIEMEKQADALQRAEEPESPRSYRIDKGLTPKEPERVVGMIRTKTTWPSQSATSEGQAAPLKTD